MNGKLLPKFDKLLFLTGLLVLGSCGGSGDWGGLPQVSNTNFEEVEFFSVEVPVDNHTQFNLIGKDGEVTVTGISGVSSVVVTAIKRVQSESPEDAKAHLQELDVNVQDLANEVRVSTIQPIDKGGRNYIVDYTITLPKFLAIHVLNLNGIVTLDSVDNDVAVSNLNGEVILSKILGSALIALLNGTIESEVTLPLNGTIDLNTLNGDINLAIPVNTSADFSAAVTIGSIDVSNLVLQNPIITKVFHSGRLGSGQGVITLEAKQIGNISVLGF